MCCGGKPFVTLFAWHHIFPKGTVSFALQFSGGLFWLTEWFAFGPVTQPQNRQWILNRNPCTRLISSNINRCIQLCQKRWTKWLAGSYFQTILPTLIFWRATEQQVAGFSVALIRVATQRLEYICCGARNMAAQILQVHHVADTETESVGVYAAKHFETYF